MSQLRLVRATPPFPTSHLKDGVVFTKGLNFLFYFVFLCPTCPSSVLKKDRGQRRPFIYDRNALTLIQSVFNPNSVHYSFLFFDFDVFLSGCSF